MSNIKIISVSLENFKGFQKSEVKFDSYQAVVLAGKNGYGKTTIFDAIELVFTGKIKRYDAYLEYHRKNTALSQEVLPLVYDSKVPYVKVAVTLKVEGKTICLYREEEHITNPINFDNVFNVLNIQYEKNGESVTEEYNGQFGLDEFLKSYSFLNYVSQEEATSFLKSKETERSLHINELFNTFQIDKQISKIAKVEKVLKNANKTLKDKIGELTHDLSAMEKGEEEKESEYIRLVADKDFDWDKENPLLSYEKFYELLCENGILDQLGYYSRHREDYAKWLRNKKIDSLLNSPLFPNFPYFYYLFFVKNRYGIYDVFKTKLLPSIHAVAIDNLQDSITPLLQSVFADIVEDDLREEIESKFEMIQPVGRSSSLLGKALADLQNERAKLKVVFDKTYIPLKLTQCPLCGQEYKESGILKEKIDEYEHILSETYPELQKGLGKMLKELRDLLAKLVRFLQAQFDEWGLTETGYAKFKEINFDAYDPYLKEILAFGELHYNPESTVKEFLAMLQKRLNDAKQELDSSVDYLTLDRVHASYVKYMTSDVLTVENIEKKRDYLTSQWNAIKSKLYKQKEAQIKLIEQKKKYCDDKISEIKYLKTKLTNYKNTYLNKVISDIEILFYVYSGRIMQENYYGRGLFIKNEPAKKRVLFVSDYHSDVDALYNLSSGQLVSIVFAFVMSLNKLYSSQAFIAIDDPVQTIDDINVWGFIETIRHAFGDSCILLSTHEDDYAALLRYKLEKCGISAKCIDMSEVRNHQV